MLKILLKIAPTIVGPIIVKHLVADGMTPEAAQEMVDEITKAIAA